MLRDLNHIKNKDLLEVFLEKVSNKKYSYIQCKLEKVKERIIELYKSLLQYILMPQGGFFFKSFVRVVVLKVMFANHINLAHCKREVERKITHY